MTARRFLRAVAGKAAACAAVCTLASSVAIGDVDPVRGAWKLEGYEVEGQAREANGILLFQDGRFGMLYTMRSAGGPLSGRAHAGAYRVTGDRLHFDVSWWVEDVDGVARVVPGVTREPRLQLDGDRLALHFANGSVQHLRRVPAAAASQAEGAWQVGTITVPNASAAPATGLLVAAGGQFALVYTEGEGERATRGQAVAGNVTGNILQVNRSVSSLDGVGTVAGAGGPALTLQGSGTIRTVTDPSGRTLSLVR